MSWSPEELSRASVEELEGFAAQAVPTLRQMHAIRELATRAVARPELAGAAADAVAEHLSPAWRMGGMPTGYLGAQVLFAGGEPARAALMAALTTAAPADREGLLGWLSPSPREAPTGPVRVERELLVHAERSEAAIREAVSEVTGEAAVADVLPLVGSPAGVAMVTLTAEGWRRLEQEGTRLSAALGTTVYWPAPAELGPLGPDVRVAVDPDGGRRRVRAVPTVGGYAILSA